MSSLVLHIFKHLPLFFFEVTTYFVSFPFMEDCSGGVQDTKAETSVKLSICKLLGDLVGAESKNYNIS